MRVSALDVGSNTFHLVVAETSRDGDFVPVVRAKEMVRLGEGTLQTRVIPSDLFERGLDALCRLRAVADHHGSARMRAVATSAVREAMNGPAFIRAAQVMCGVDIEVVDAAEEARLITLGARRALALGSRRVALFDLGGGSLEMIVSDRDTILHTRSLPLGSLRLAEVWLRDDPPDPRQLEQMRREIRKALVEPIAEMAAVGFDFVAFSSGTAKTVRSILAARGSADGSNEAMTVDSLRALDRELGRLPAAERVQLPGLHPGRCDSIVTGTAVLRQILELTGHASATLSPGAIREGILADMLVRPTSRPGRTSERPRPGSAAI